jgi:phosphatidylserine/phosphatidylglycerophosphate/cardiolipin synthase-like enzyme
MTKTPSRRQRRGPADSRRVQIGTTSGLIIIAIVFFVQFVLGIDVLHLDDITATPASTVSTSVPTPSIPAPTPRPTIVAAAPGAALVPIPGGYDGGWFQLYFTEPINTRDESLFTASPVEGALVAALDGARFSIDAAVFEMNSQPVTDALLRAQERGVRVRMVTDGEYGLERPDATFDQIEFSGIELRSDQARRGLMHNKFFVIDRLYVWTGSTNVTHNGMYNNNNNAMLIRSSRLAANFTAEFEEMFGGSFGVTSPATVPNPLVTVDGTPIETIFEAEGDVPARLAELIANARSVRFMAFSLTRDDLIQPMVTRAQAGELDLMGVIEASQRRFLTDLVCAGLPIQQDGNPNILHHKVFIIDESIVVMGSFNFSGNAADSNDENTLIIYNTAIARAYLEEFARRWNESQPIPELEFDC